MTLAPVEQHQWPAAQLVYATTPPAAPVPAAGNEWVDLVSPAAELANRIANTDFVPDSMRGKPAAVCACILYGAELGLGPMVSLAKIDIIKGRPAPRAELARALAIAAGHEFTVEANTTQMARCTLRRRNGGKAHTVTWTMDDVRKAGISSPMYVKYPRQMLLARASVELVRAVCPEVLGGITMFAEEIVDDVLVEPTAAELSGPAAEPAKPTTRQRTRRTTPKPETPAPQPAAVDDDPPLDDDGPALATDAQIMKMQASFNDLGIKKRDDRLAFIATAARPVPSSKDLTIDEASTVIDTLERVVAGAVTMTFTDDGITLEAVDIVDEHQADEDVDTDPPLNDEDPDA